MTIPQKELTAMNKKVLIVSSSPRKHGNSDLLCDEFSHAEQKTQETRSKRSFSPTKA